MKIVKKEVENAIKKIGTVAAHFEDDIFDGYFFENEQGKIMVTVDKAKHKTIITFETDKYQESYSISKESSLSLIIMLQQTHDNLYK